MNNSADMRRERQTSGQLTAKSISIKDAERKSDGCARKAVELTSGDLSCVADSRLREPRGDLTLGQKSAEGVVVTQVAKARTVPLPRGKGSGE
ncbi:MAG: hypothetical protein H0U18_09990 [Pyrinomonadaceae bacterium]|nr:hypothetical protein [Pyrinomonadaceae bacterium]